MKHCKRLWVSLVQKLNAHEIIMEFNKRWCLTRLLQELKMKIYKKLVAKGRLQSANEISKECSSTKMTQDFCLKFSMWLMRLKQKLFDMWGKEVEMSTEKYWFKTEGQMSMWNTW